jgi:uncharacterized surface protein with fasciclin (FAS1) repeats
MLIATLCVVTLAFAACSSDSDSEANDTTTTEAQAPETQDQTIVDIAAGNEDFSTLVDLVTQAGLVETLSDPDAEFTVFAPTNDAFAKVDAATLEALGNNKDALTQVLTYHAVAAKALSGDLSDGQELTTVEGGTLTVGITDGKVTLTTDGGTTVNVTTADIEASNGVIHVIDGVLIPADLAL